MSNSETNGTSPRPAAKDGVGEALQAARNYIWKQVAKRIDESGQPTPDQAAIINRIDLTLSGASAAGKQGEAGAAVAKMVDACKSVLEQQFHEAGWMPLPPAPTEGGTK